MAADAKALADCLFSMGMLKRTERSGWRTIGVQQPESVADHSFGAAMVGLALARMEKADEGKVLKMCLLHDLHELRMGDLNKLNKRYVERDERKAFRETVEGMEPTLRGEMERLFEEFLQCETLEARIAKDADALDMMLEAKLLVDTGNRYAKDWIRSAWEKISTKSGKELGREIEKRDSLEWLMKMFHAERARGKRGRK
ncbi:MAG: HD domain-containing protein [Candidatus Micrarchaeia archaeon]|jgi:putative hydrolase of HD superfamily